MAHGTLVLKILDTELCLFYHETKKSINHLFYNCLHAQKIWITIQKNLKNVCDIDVYFHKQIVNFECNYDNSV